MQSIKVPWQKWLLEREEALTFPDSWKLHFADEIMKVPDIGEEGIRRAFRSPIGMPSISEVARGRKNAVIAIDDISRPTPTHRLINYVLDGLALGGIDHKNVRIIVGSGAHRQSTRLELATKVGQEILDSVDMVHHVPYENLVDLGESELGTPISTNRDFYEGDLKIAIGSIMPHATAGFGGGRKLVAVGLSSVKTLRAFHKRDNGWLRTGCIQGNIQHKDLDDIMQRVGLDIAVEVVLTGKAGIAGLFVGEPIKCFDHGVEHAWQTYSTFMPKDNDILVLNAYPKDYDLLQACNALWVSLYPNLEMIRPGGTVVVTAACPDGAGLHFLATYGMSDPTWFEEASFQGRNVIIYSPNVSECELHRHFPKSVKGYRHWEDVLAELHRTHSDKSQVTIFPCAPLHLDPTKRGSGALAI
jgi:nickel-dependent lactate racemase